LLKTLENLPYLTLECFHSRNTCHTCNMLILHVPLIFGYLSRSSLHFLESALPTIKAPATASAATMTTVAVHPLPPSSSLGWGRLASSYFDTWSVPPASSAGSRGVKLALFFANSSCSLLPSSCSPCSRSSSSAGCGFTLDISIFCR